jgi:predicted enzyme related to lactoylglutathione lyase
MRARIAGFAAVAILIGATGQAAVTLNAARVAGPDVAALASFYESAFGLQEVNRLQVRENIEIMLNFGATAAAAKSNSGAQIVIMHRASGGADDPIPHLIFNVTDMAATAAAVKSAGGSMAGEPRVFGNTGIKIGIAVDPAGNRIELIQPPAH